jgi:hypothetical protein
VFPILFVVVIVGGHMATIGNNNCNVVIVKGWGLLHVVVHFLTTKKGSREGRGSTHN